MEVRFEPVFKSQNNIDGIHDGDIRQTDLQNPFNLKLNSINKGYLFLLMKKIRLERIME
tara:strand:+ start:411 stop:587 length:177 start_codon:yes stop_codon:yes gene_type:complete